MPDTAATLPPAGPVIYVPCSHVGCGTGTAAVTDCMTRLPVRLTDPRLCLVGGVVCARGRSVRRLDGRHLVRFPGGVAAWVRPLPAVPPASAAA